eukprot:gene12381-14526_t
MDQPITKDGALSLLSPDGKSWKKRHCTLKNRIFYIYESKTKLDNFLHFIPLARCGVITTALKGPNGKAFCFKLSHQMDEAIMYWLSAETEAEMTEWVNQLQACSAIQQEPERVEAVRGRSKSVIFKPMALQLAGISDHSGWLKKQSGGGLRKAAWKKRWFVLKDMVLYYYDGPESKQLKGKVSIPNWSVEADATTGGYCFKLSHTGCPSVILQAETDEERNRWINNIKDSDKYLTQSSSLTDATPNKENDVERMTKLKEWMSSVTTLNIQEPSQFLFNITFVANLLEKLGVKVNIGDKPDAKEKERDWSSNGFDIILKEVIASGIKFEPSITSQAIISFACSLQEHFANRSTSSLEKQQNVVEQPAVSVTVAASQNNGEAADASTPSSDDLSETSDKSTTPSLVVPVSTNPTATQIVFSASADTEAEEQGDAILNALINAQPNIATTQSHSLPATPVKPAATPISKIVSPHRPQLKRVETQDVIGEFDKLFSSFGSNLTKCGHCKEPITGDSVDACGTKFHPHHLLCCSCGKHLIGMEDVPYVDRNGSLYCKEDHDKTFKDSNCSVCSKSLMITFAYKGKLFCNEHFVSETADITCQGCEKPLGELPYYSIDNKKWHRNHFSCNYCKVALPHGQCQVNKGMPYCSKCHVSLF